MFLRFELYRRWCIRKLVLSLYVFYKRMLYIFYIGVYGYDMIMVFFLFIVFNNYGNKFIELFVNISNVFLYFKFVIIIWN